MKKYWPYIKNKYILTSIAVFVWLFFFDQNNFIRHYEFKQEINQLEEDKDFYEQEVVYTRDELEALLHDPVKLEKYAREKYLMKKENEEIFVFVKE